MIEISIHDESCRGCSMCVDICPTSVFAMDEAAGKALVNEAADCVGCLTCSYLCPSGAIQHADHHVVMNFYRDLDFSLRVARFL